MPHYGRVHAVEPLSNLMLVHRHDGSELHTSTFEPPLCVLNQQTLVAQGITTASVVAGARPGIDALGSCTAQATTAHLSQILTKDAFKRYCVQMAHVSVPFQWNPYTDSEVAEEAAIGFYAFETKATGTTSTEWPPTDCGSSGPYIAEGTMRLGFVQSQKIAQTPQDLVSLLQTGSVLQGTPFFMAWEKPDAEGFVDQDGSVTALNAAVASGVAGGHETLICAIEAVEQRTTGAVVPERTVLRVRNSWGLEWGHSGDFRIHLSTLAALGHYCDFRGLVPFPGAR